MLDNLMEKLGFKKKPEEGTKDPGQTYTERTGNVMAAPPAPYGDQNDPLVAAMHQKSVTETQANMQNADTPKIPEVTTDTQTPQTPAPVEKAA